MSCVRWLAGHADTTPSKSFCCLLGGYESHPQQHTLGTKDEIQIVNSQILRQAPQLGCVVALQVDDGTHTGIALRCGAHFQAFLVQHVHKRRFQVQADAKQGVEVHVHRYSLYYGSSRQRCCQAHAQPRAAPRLHVLQHDFQEERSHKHDGIVNKFHDPGVDELPAMHTPHGEPNPAFWRGQVVRGGQKVGLERGGHQVRGVRLCNVPQVFLVQRLGHP